MIWIAALAMLAQEPATESVVDKIKRELGLDDIQIHGFVRPRINYYDDLITLGRDTTTPTFRGRDDRNLYFADLRAWLSLGLSTKPWGLFLKLDVGGNDFNDGGMLGNDTDVVNSNLGLGPAGLRDFDVDIGEAYVYFEDDGWKVEVGRLPHNWAHGIVTRIHRDSIRVAKKIDVWTFRAVVVSGGQSAQAVDPTGGVTGDDSAVKFTTGNIGEFGVFALNAGLDVSKEFRAELTAAKQMDATRDQRFTQKIFFDTAAFYASAPWEASVEACYLTGKGAKSAALGKRPDYSAYLAFAKTRYEIGESGVKAGLAAGIGSGDSTPANDEVNGFENLFMNEVGFAYTYIYSDDIHGYNGSAASVRRASGFANTWFLQPNVRWAATDALVFTASYTHLRAVRRQPEGAGPLGLSFGGRGNYGLDPAMRVDPTGTKKTRDIGYEIDFGGEFQASKHVRIPVNLGFFRPGDIFGHGARTAAKFDLGLEYRF
jgi:hypothetical protein